MLLLFSKRILAAESKTTITLTQNPATSTWAYTEPVLHELSHLKVFPVGERNHGQIYEKKNLWQYPACCLKLFPLILFFMYFKNTH